MTEMSWAEKNARLQQTNLSPQFIYMQDQINELNAKLAEIEQALNYYEETPEEGL
jgi:prefoldin subunit 5